MDMEVIAGVGIDAILMGAATWTCRGWWTGLLPNEAHSKMDTITGRGNGLVLDKAKTYRGHNRILGSRTRMCCNRGSRNNYK